MGASVSCNPTGPVQTCAGIALPLPLPPSILRKSKQIQNPLIFIKKVVAIPCSTFSAERVQDLVCSLSCDGG
jgi:hypothetical protein